MKRPLKLTMVARPNRSLDLIPLPVHTRVSESAESFAQHVQNLHKEISHKINLTNELYKRLANSRKRDKEFIEDLVMIRLRPE